MNAALRGGGAAVVGADAPALRAAVLRRGERGRVVCDWPVSAMRKLGWGVVSVLKQARYAISTRARLTLDGRSLRCGIHPASVFVWTW